MEKREPSCTVGGNENSCSHYEKWYGVSLKKRKKLEIELPHDSAIPLQGIYPEINKNTNLKRYMYLRVHSRLFTTAKTCKQPSDHQQTTGFRRYGYAMTFTQS